MLEVAQLMAALDAEVAGQPTPTLSVSTFRLLQDVWDSLDGGDETRMSWRKLSADRVEDLRWERPVLKFVIERHGGTVHGSSRADLYERCVDLAALTADVQKKGYRQLVQNDKPLDTKKLAAEVAAMIAANREATFLVWSEDKKKVRLIVSKVIPETNAQTTAARRQRFRFDIESEMAALGWAQTGQYRFAPPAN